MENQMPNNQPVNNNPMMDYSNMSPKKESSIGAIVATIVIIALIVLGGLYFWGKRMESEKARKEILSSNNSVSVVDETAAALDALNIETVSNSDDLNTLEAELNATDLSSINTNLE